MLCFMNQFMFNGRILCLNWCYVWLTDFMFDVLILCLMDLLYVWLTDFMFDVLIILIYSLICRRDVWYDIKMKKIERAF